MKLTLFTQPERLLRLVEFACQPTNNWGQAFPILLLVNLNKISSETNHIMLISKSARAVMMSKVRP